MDRPLAERLWLDAKARLPGWLYASLRRQVVVSKRGDGLLAALWIPANVADRIAMPGGERPEDLHCSIAMFTHLGELPADGLSRLMTAVAKAAATCPTLFGRIGGAGFFEPDKNRDTRVLYASLDVPGLDALRQRILHEAAELNLIAEDAHGFSPHVTLAYLPGAEPAPALPQMPTPDIRFDSVTACAGATRREIPIPSQPQGGVRTLGPVDAPVAFIGSAPSPTDCARREPLSGLDGETFASEFLAPLGLSRDQVVVGNLMPVGPNRRPVDDEIASWAPWLKSELDRLQPRAVVALGQQARLALGRRADFVLPHPAIVRKRGGNELPRKLVQVRKAIEMAQARDIAPPAPGDDRQIGWAWETDWKRIPPKGSAYLMGGKALVLMAECSRGADLLWCWEIDPASGEPIGPGFRKAAARLTTVAGRSAQDGPSLGYRLGTCSQGRLEILLDNGADPGRYLLSREPGAAGWLIEKPADQRATSDVVPFADIKGDLIAKRERWLRWGEPGRPRLIDLRTDEQVLSPLVAIAKADAAKKIVYGVVLDPYGENGAQPDAHEDWVPPADVERCAHDFMRGPRAIGIQHEDRADARVVESWVEQYPSLSDYKKAMLNEPHRVTRRKFGSDLLHSGSWVMGVELGDREWQMFQDGTINAFSPGGFGVRTPMTRAQFPSVTFLDLVEQPA